MHKRNMLDVFFVSTFLLSVLMINVSKVEAAATTQVSVVPSQLTVGNPDVLLPTPLFTINITVQDVEDLYAWQIVLYYNSTILSTRPDLIIIPTENIFKGKGYLPLGPYIEVDSKGTYIQIGATLSGKVPGVTGSGVLCQINFTGQATGTSELNLADKTEKTQHDDYTLLAKLDSPLDEIDPISIVDGQVTVIGIEDPREPSTITINVNPSTVKVGSNVTITGTINPTRAEVDVTIYYVPALGKPGSATVQTKEFNATHCRYEYNWTTEEANEYGLYAYSPGDANYREATSNTATVTVNKWPSTISLNAYPTKVPVGSNVIINGTISTPKPVLPYENVTISYRRGGGEENTLEIVSPDEDGVYTYTWETSEAGSYDLRASWLGDKYSDSTYSIELTVEVTGESMAYLYYIIAAIAIIAIATIGIYFTKIRKRQHAADK